MSTNNNDLSSQMRTAHGVIRGKTIELEESLGLVDGQKVEIEIRALGRSEGWGAGIERSAGGWNHLDGVAETIQRIQQERKLDRPESN